MHTHTVEMRDGSDCPEFGMHYIQGRSQDVYGGGGSFEISLSKGTFFEQR